MNNINIAAGIDIGSNALRLIIAEIKDSGEIITLEELKKHNTIGRDTFANGRISIKTIKNTCEILNNFKKLMNEYQVEHYEAVATSGMRESENMDFVLEQIRLKTGIKVRIINSAEERYLTYKALRDILPFSEWMKNNNLLIVDIGSGGVEVSVYINGNLKFTTYSKVGSLRLSQILSDLESLTLDFPDLMEEFIDSKMHYVKPIINNYKIDKFIGLGGETGVILELNSNNTEKKFIRRREFQDLYQRFSQMNNDLIVEKYQIDARRMKLLLPSIIIFNYFLKIIDVSEIYMPYVSIRHGLVVDMVDKWFDTDRGKDFREDIISSAKYIGKKYKIDEKHSDLVEKFAVSIFERLSDIHGLGEREKLYLKVATILHETGKYITLNEYDQHSYNIINAQDIIGFSDRELRMIANIAKYHYDLYPKNFHKEYKKLKFNDRMIVAKLAAVLKIADSLDLSYRQKIKDINIEYIGDELHFIVHSSKDMMLERWSFKKNTKYFEEVIGIKPVLRVKDDLNEL